MSGEPGRAPGRAAAPAPCPGAGVALVTGSTSELGRLVVAELLERGRRVRALVRTRDSTGAEALRAGAAAALEDGRLELVHGEALEPDLGLGRSAVAALADLTEIVHLARPRQGEAAPPGALLIALDAVVGLARRLPAERLRRVIVLSTTAVAGDYPGRFYEDWLEVGQTFSTVAGRAAQEHELRARASGIGVPIVIARHAPLVGHSRTGRSECPGPIAPLFALGPLLSALPSWVPLPGAAEGPRYVTVTPVDYLAAGLAALSCSEQVEAGRTYCLADPDPPTLGELSDLLTHRLGGPEVAVRLPVDGRGPVGRAVAAGARAAAAASRLAGRGPGVLALLLARGEHDTRNARAVLEPLGIRCPRLATYLDALHADYLRRRRRSR